MAVRVINVELSSLARWHMICLCLIASPVSCPLFVLNVSNIESFGNVDFKLNHNFFLPSHPISCLDKYIIILEYYDNIII